MGELSTPEYLGKYFFGELWFAVETVFKTQSGASWAELWECTEGYEEGDTDFNFMFINCFH